MLDIVRASTPIVHRPSSVVRRRWCKTCRPKMLPLRAMKILSLAFVLLADVTFCGVPYHRDVAIVDNDANPDEGLSDNDNQDAATNEIIPEDGEPLNELDFINGNKLDLDKDEESLYSSDEDPLSKAGLFEGDIQDIANISDLLLGGRNAIIDTSLRWPDGEIPYTLSSEYSTYERSVIARSMSDYHSRTCIRFRPKTSGDSDYIHLTKGQGCSSSVGRQGGGQQVSLSTGCIHHGIVSHELMHAVGFWHEQSRADRDSYITIIWSNIMRGMEYNFQKYSWQYIQHLDEPYDIGSVMHYDAYAFSSQRGLPTIMTKDKKRLSNMGQRHGFSATDIRKINKLYECKSTAGGAGGGTGTGTDTDTDNGTGSTKVKLIPPKPKGQCLDSDPQCRSWANAGECKRNPVWMKANCLKSCGICERSSCVDNSAKCKKWALDSECDNNPQYMLHYCKKSCGSC